MMKKSDPFLDAYYEFRETVDFSRNRILPDRDNMVSYLLMGVPRVPAEVKNDSESLLEAIDQRVIILKAVFAELNNDAEEDFLDEGLKIYDTAAERAKTLLKETDDETDN
jgi:hypothetical protein